MSHRSALTVVQEGGNALSWPGGAPALLGRREVWPGPWTLGLGLPKPRAPHCTLPRRCITGSLFPGQGVGMKPTPDPGDTVISPDPRAGGCLSESCLGPSPGGRACTPRKKALGLCLLSAQCRGPAVLGWGLPASAAPKASLGCPPAHSCRGQS